MSTDPSRPNRGIEYHDDKRDAKRLNLMQKQIEQLQRLIQRMNNPNTTVKITSNAGSVDTPTVNVNHADLLGLTNDDHELYLNRTGERAMTGALDMGTQDINDINVLRFNITPTNATPVAGDIYWSAADDTLNIVGPDGQITQVGQEITVPVFNNTGTLILDGDVVYLSGGNGRPFIAPADADSIETSSVLGIATHDIADQANGKVTVLGLVRGLDTSGTTVNQDVFLSSTTGEWTTTRPTFPAWISRLGKIELVDASNGIILMLPIVFENLAFFFGTINENFDFTVSEAGGTVTGSLEQTGGGDLHIFWPSGIEVLVTAPLTIDLTANVGTDTTPKDVYVFLDGTTKTIAQNTTGWPTNSHVKIAYLRLWSAARTGVDGPRVNQNWNNYSASVTDLRGRLELLSEKVRRLGASYFTGISANGATTSYFTLTAADGFFLSTAGTAYQMNLQTVPAITMSTVPGDPAFVINNATTPDTRITDLYSIQTLADGTTALINNQHFNLVFAVIVNKAGVHLIVTLPTGQYKSNANGLAAAKRDDEKFSVFDLGRDLTIDSSTAIFVGRATFKFKTLGTAWEFIQFDNLLGKDPTQAGSAGLGYTDEDAVAAVEGEATLDLTGAVTQPSINVNTSVTIDGFLDEDNQVSDSATKGVTQQSIKKYVDDLDALAVHLAGSETLTGAKTFSALLTASASLNVTGAITGTTILDWTSTTNRMFTQNFNTTFSSATFWSMERAGTEIFRIGSLTNGAAFSIADTSLNHRLVVLAAGGVLVNRTTSSADIFEVTGDAGKTVGGTEWNAISDIGVKNMIGDYNLGLDLIMQIQPKTFRYKEIYGLKASTRDEVGIVSQDIEKIAPSMIENRIEKYKSDNHKEGDTLLETPLKWFTGGNDIKYTMVNAIKELKAENDKQASTIDILIAHISDLTERLDNIGA